MTAHDSGSGSFATRSRPSIEGVAVRLRVIAGFDDAEHLIAQRVEIGGHSGAADRLGLSDRSFETAREIEQ